MSRSSARASRIAVTTSSRIRARSRRGPPPPGEPVGCRASKSSDHGRSVAVVTGQQRQLGSPSGRRRRRAAGTRTPGCPWTSTSSRRPARSSRRGCSAGRTAPTPVSTSLCAAEHSWCGKIRSLPPPCTSIVGPSRLPAITEHSMCQPGRPGPIGDAQDGSPSAPSATAAGPAGCACPAGPDRRRAPRPAPAWWPGRTGTRSRTSARWRCRSTHRDARGRRPGRPRPCPAGAATAADTSSMASTAPM